MPNPRILAPAYIEPPAKSSTDARIDLVIAALPEGLIQPAHLAPLLGISRAAVYHHCRECKALAKWKGQYRFFMDDAEHVEALRAVIRRVLWAGRKLPAELKSH